MKERDPARKPFWKRPRWVYAAAAFAMGVFDTSMAQFLGIDFQLAGRDITFFVGAFVEISFATFGYLLGAMVEARSGERSAARREQGQLEELATTRARLAQHEKLAALGQLASTLAHEVRNPLAILRSLAQNLEEDLHDRDPKSAASCRAQLDEIDRLSHVVSSLVGFARPLQLQRATVQAEEIVERVGLLAGPMLEEQSIRLISQETRTDPAQVSADSDLLCQVLLGLLANAAAVTPDGGVVRLGWSRRGDDEIEFTVVDQGPGVPEEIRPRIFEPFFTTREDGSGLSQSSLSPKFSNQSQKR